MRALASDELLRRELRRVDRVLAQAHRVTPRPTADPAARFDALISLLAADRAAAPGAVPDEAPVVLAGLAQTVTAYDLSPFDRDLLLVAASAYLDTRYRDALRLLAGDAAPTLGLYIDLVIASSGIARDVALGRGAADGPLLGNALVRVDREDRVSVPDPVWRRIAGLDGGCTFELCARHAIEQLIVAPATRGAFDRAATWARTQGRCIIVVRGRPGVGRTAVAAALADALSRRALLVRADDAPAEIVREARWFGAIPVIGDAAESRAPALDLARLTEAVGVAIVIGGAVHADLPVLDLEVAPLARPARRRLWVRALGDETAGVVDRVIDRRLGPGRILAAARRAREIAAVAGTLTGEDVQIACRRVGDEAVGMGADRVERTLALADLVIPAATRRELELAIAWGRQLEELPARGGPHLASSGGLACLFWGPPGTGKTSAAQVIAGELGLELYRIDLSRVIDKYIGETEKHLSEIFDQAELHNFVLLFDEADALFGRRTELTTAHDRFANVETSYLLQRLEQHRGIAILATNLRNNLDPAFLRRLHVMAEFPLPAVAERRALWQRMVPTRRANDVDLELLATKFALSGGDIRNAVLTALVLAGEQPVSMRDLVIGVWREQTRSGRLVDGAELGPWQREVASWLGGEP